MAEKSIHDLVLEDFDACPVWDTVQFDVEGGVDSTVEPVQGKARIDGTERLPYVRVHGELADGTPLVGIANVFLDPPRLYNPSLLIGKSWQTFFLPPAPSFVLAQQGPEPFASLFGKPIEAVFPITLSSEVLIESTGMPIRTVFSTSGVEVA